MYIYCLYKYFDFAICFLIFCWLSRISLVRWAGIKKYVQSINQSCPNADKRRRKKPASGILKSLAWWQASSIRDDIFGDVADPPSLLGRASKSTSMYIHICLWSFSLVFQKPKIMNQCYINLLWPLKILLTFYLIVNHMPLLVLDKILPQRIDHKDLNCWLLYWVLNIYIVDRNAKTTQ